MPISARALAVPPAAPYLADLNPEQRAAVEALDGPVLVLAGAGTGKTRVLTARIAHIVCTGRAHASQILAVTFTNKAAREMKERIGALVGGAVEGMPWLGTFHAIGVKILRRHAELVGLKSGFTILDTDDQIRLIKQVIESEGLDKDRWPARHAGGPDRRLEESRADAGQGAARGKLRLRRGQGRAALRRLSEAPQGAQCRRLRRPAARGAAAVPREPGRARRLPAPLPLHAGRRVPGHQRRPVPVAAADRVGLAQHLLRRRRRPVDLRLARRRGRQHPALRARLSRRQGHPAGAQLSLQRPHPGGRLRPDRPQQGPPRQDAFHRPRHGARRSPLPAYGTTRRKRATSATTSRRCTRRGTGSTRSPSWCGPRSRCAPSRIASSRWACPIG